MRYLIGLIILTALSLNSCSNANKDKIIEDTDTLEVSLNWNTDEKVKFSEIKYKRFLAFSTFKKFPDRYRGLLNSVSNIPKLDSFMLISLNLQKLPTAYRLYKIWTN
jgi:hypothetical protein